MILDCIGIELIMQNSMSPPKMDNPFNPPKKRPRRDFSPPISRSRTRSSRVRFVSSSGTNQQYRYIKGMKARERVDKILLDLHQEHRWTIKDLLYYMVTEDSSEKWAPTPEKRAKDISTAIFERPEVLNALSRASNQNPGLQISSTICGLQKELQHLSLQLELGKFDANVDPKDMDMSGLVSRVNDCAPLLWRLLQALTENPEYVNRGRSSVRNPDGALLMICAILAHQYAPRRCNSFQMILGLHLHSMGVKRRTINLLSGFGLALTYNTIINHMNDIAKIGEVS